LWRLGGWVVWIVTCMLAMYAVKVMRVLMFQQMVNAGSNVIDFSHLTNPAVFFDQGFARHALVMGRVRWMGRMG